MVGLLQPLQPLQPLQTETQKKFAAINELSAMGHYLKNYNKDIVKKLSHYFTPKGQVLEFGAGMGTLAQLWETLTGNAPDCLEIDEELCETISQKGLHCYQSIEAIQALEKTYEGIYTSNVLEHIEDDVAALKQLYSILESEGVIAIYVPAFMCIYSPLDAAVGHYRRYQKKELLLKVKSAGFETIDAYYVDSLGFFAWLTTKFSGSKKNKKQNPERSLAIYDRYFYPLSKILDKCGMRFIFGKSLLVVARKK